MISLLPPQRRRIFVVDEGRRVAGGRVTRRLSVDRGTMRHGVCFTLGFVGGGLGLFVFFVAVPWRAFYILADFG